MNFKQALAGIAMVLVVAFTIAAATTNPQKVGAMYSTNGSGNPGTWAAMTGTGAPYTGNVAPVGLFVSTDGSGNPGTWVPVTQSSFSPVSGPTLANHVMCSSNTTGTLVNCDSINAAVVFANTANSPGSYDLVFSPNKGLNFQDSTGHFIGYLASETGTATAQQNWLPYFQIGAGNATQSGRWLAVVSGDAGVWSNPFASNPTDWYSANLFLPGSGGQWNKIAPDLTVGSAVYTMPHISGTLAVAIVGTTAAIGGSALTAGTCASGTATVTGATTAMGVIATPVTYPGDPYTWKGYISAANTATVKVCTNLAAGGTPTSSAYNVRVIP